MESWVLCDSALGGMGQALGIESCTGACARVVAGGWGGAGSG